MDTVINGKYIKQGTVYLCSHPQVEHCFLMGTTDGIMSNRMWLMVQLRMKDGSSKDFEVKSSPDGSFPQDALQRAFQEAEDYLETLKTDTTHANNK